jgi:hypothetical protein
LTSTSLPARRRERSPVARRAHSTFSAEGICLAGLVVAAGTFAGWVALGPLHGYRHRDDLPSRDGAGGQPFRPGSVTRRRGSEHRVVRFLFRPALPSPSRFRTC